MPDSTPLLHPGAVAQLENMELRARLIVEGFITGLHRSPYHGFSVEFAEHRAYNPGDELRHIDWKAFAKTDRFYVKQYEEETNLRQYVVLDSSSSMRYQGEAPVSKFEYGVYLSAALHFLMSKQRDATGLMAFDERIHTIRPPGSTRRHLRELLVTLERLLRDVRERQRTRAANALEAIAAQIHRRSLVILITDLFENVGRHDDLLRSLRHLRHRGHEVLVFHVLDSRTERAFELPDHPTVLRDMETGEEMTVRPGALQETYAEAVQLFSDRFRRSCLEHGIDFVEVDTNEPFDNALLAYLTRRARLT